MLLTTHLHRKALVILAICTLSFLGLNASAQSVDTGILTVKGSVQISTCRVNFRNQGESGFTSVPVLDLGNFKTDDFLRPNATPENPVEVTRNAPKVMVVSLSSTTEQNQVCVLGGSQTWDLQISSATTGATTRTKSFLASSSPTDTNALVGIKGTVIPDITLNEATFTNFLDVSNRTINVGTGTSGVTANATSGIAIRAAFVSVSPTVAPTPGIFNSPITLTTVYK